MKMKNIVLDEFDANYLMFILGHTRLSDIEAFVSSIFEGEYIQDEADRVDEILFSILRQLGEQNEKR